MVNLSLCFAIFICMVLVAPHAKATINCGLVTKSVAPCISYLNTSVGNPSPECCNGIKTISSLASTPTDRKIACSCLKSAANALKTLNYSKAARLPTKCGVSIPYAISPKTDCSRVN